MSEYKRLTKKDNEYGYYVQNQLSELNEPSIAVSCYGKIHGTVIDRLAELEDKIENGTLIELPCKVGDIVYQLDNGGEIYELMILTITIHTNKFYYETLGIDFDNRAIGETVFLTKAEAEAKLRELEGEV